MTAVDFRDHVFTASPERHHPSRAVLERLMGRDRPFRVLDLGCGTGAQLLAIAAKFPCAECVGIDISPGNIQRAEIMAATSEHRLRLSYHHADYLEFASEPFNVIIADSVLQNIPVSTATLIGKISNDLKPEALLITTLPYDCAYNHLLWAGRRLLRHLRGPILEHVAETVARLLHPSWPGALIRERVPYLYLLPERIDGEALRRTLHTAGRLEVLEEHTLPHASPAQPKHRLVVFRKQAT